MRILVAPDKFKGSLDARGIAENVAAGLRDALPDAKIDIVPMADGGEGTAEVICDALGGSWLKCRVHDPLGREIDAHYAYINGQKLAVMEMSEAAGMRRLRPNERDVDLSSTFGVGEMIVNAASRGPRDIVVGLGGSATNDGGFGMARALGFRFFAGERELRGAVGELLRLTRIEAPAELVGALVSSARPLERRLAQAPLQPGLPKIIAAVDVRNPLLGQNGATRVFGPQKGATAEKSDILEQALRKLADVVSKDLHCDFRDEPGAGAAGGLGFGLMSFCDAIIRPGFDVVAQSIGLESKMKDADVVITGEGSLDQQTLEGKTPAGVARLSRKFGKRVFAIVGRASKDRQVQELFDGVYELAQPGMSEQENMARAAELLRKKARELGRTL